MTVQVLDEGINAWDKDIRRFVESSNIETYNPIRDYIVGLPVWDGIDRITPLALRVPTDNRDWPRHLHRWLLGMVAQWMGIEPMYGLTMVPLLVGKQGDGKSTFCRLLLPPELREYYTDRIDFSNRNDAERSLSRFCLINIDEFDSITRSQTAFLKHILQKTSYKQRRLYTQTVEENVRYAAFIGTTNDPTPLVDPSGSRRYLCIRTAGAIDTLSPFDYQQTYAQLRAEIGRNERCYFDREDEERIQQSNMEFQQFDSLEEIFREMFRKPTYAETGREMSVSSIVNAMHQRYSVIKCNDGTYRRLGRILRRNEFTHHKTAATHNYMVVEKPEAE
jgi:predicted P-loop ATPase